jgi:hypothetical protein
MLRIIKEIFKRVKEMEASVFQMVCETIDRIGSLVVQAAELQRPCVERICPECKDPCCSRVHYLYTEKDILYLRLSGRRQTWRREGFMKKGCWFLGSKGCSLDLHSRPFICHSYICPDLESAIRESGPEVMSQLRELFRLIGMLRRQMWSEYLDESRDGKRQPIQL